MAPMTWIAGLVLAASSLVSGVPQVPDSATTPNDSASQFVSDLIANATRAEQDQAHEKRFLSCSQDSSLVVNLGYAKYRGVHTASTGLNSWKGIRYAAPPTGHLRWQPPHALPLRLNAPITDAAAFGPICPQTMPAVPNVPFIPGNEDCLFLNVYAPPNASKLPVLVYIHEGGYGMGDGTHDMSEIINANEKGFVAVTLQYRLGAFGWLSSKEVKKNGAVNAGMLDQAFALAWVKLYICQFGGDPSQVTIAGESAGGGSVMYHGIALKGDLGNLLYKQGIAASPYLPFQYKYDDALPTSKYYAFSQAAGCPSSGNVFDCLVSKDTDTLQQASFDVTQASTYGYWAFWPVTDNSYILNRPGQQLPTKKMNGQNLLVGHNANEGPLFVPPILTTQSDVVNWLQGSEFPNLTPAQINTILAANPNDAVTSATGPHFETDGLGSATAVHVSQDANGQQQRANNIYAEATFACPAYWLASAYSDRGASSWLYQYSVPYAFHGSDVAAYFGPQTPNQSDDFALAFRRIWGNFVRTGNPSISAPLANGAGAANPNAPHPATNWPAWSDAAPKLINLNTTGGVASQTPLPWGPVVTQFTGPGLANAISLASAAQWEGGRKARCDVYIGLAASIPL
ncbi:acetylcholinesterase [Chaetomidium leptoderma]|uniref:Carboxylic ester hydrolase n=1 Tax=Chaetomidium leptoderma TaxID=669021 RepID=A0AAN6VCA9_9PEZI|nr:acetylcholinesterase [Chaetomidium leptoderma]